MPLTLQSRHGAICDHDPFSEYARRGDLEGLHSIFRAVPRTISRKLKYVALLPHVKSERTKRALELLVKAKIVRRVMLSSCGGLRLASGGNPKFSKLRT